MVINVIFLQDSAPIVVEVDADLLPTVDAIASEYGLTASGDPHPSKGIGMDLVTLDDATPIIMLQRKEKIM